MKEVSLEALPQFTLQIIMLMLSQRYHSEENEVYAEVDAIDIISLVLSFVSMNYSIGSFVLDSHLNSNTNVNDNCTLTDSLRLLAVEFASALAQPFIISICIIVSLYIGVG